MRPTRSLAAILLSLSLGCPAPDPVKTDDTAVPEVDADGDGYASTVDCDDADPEIHPGAEELCDAIDNDCDGFVDDDDADLADGQSWWLDEDNDGYGADDSELRACDQPEGYKAQGGDCDDSDDTVNPAKREECDGIDNNCDGEVDEDGALWSETYYEDADGDGYGDASSSRLVCEADSGWVLDDDDCDDGDAGVYPGAPELVEGVDEDCDGLFDEHTPDDAWAVIEGESAGDRAGRALSGAGDQDGDGLQDWFVGARGDDDARSDAGAVYLVAGDDTGQRSLANATAKLTGTTGALAGHALDGGVDLDGDGSIELVVGGPYDDSYEPNAGVAWVVSGPFEDGSLADATALWGLYDTDLAGWSVALLGDADGDGLGEVVVGAPYGKHGASSPGVAYLVSGVPDDDLVLHDDALRLIGESDYDGVGSRVANGGDLDGDGLADLLIGASGVNLGGADSGAAYVLLGATISALPGALDLGNADGRHHGESGYDMAGYGLAGAGDVDGDGLDDLLVGAPYEDEGARDAGAAYLLLGPATSFASLAEAPAKLIGTRTGGSAGNAVALVADADADGQTGLLVGAPVYEDGVDAGWAAMWLGQPSGTVELDDASWLFQGDQVGDYAGFALASPGDMDGDGVSDLLIGASLNDNAGAEAGAVSVLYAE